LNSPVNLNRARKSRVRADKKVAAQKNAVKSGLTKAQRVLNATRNEKATKMLDQHDLDSET